MDRDEIISRVSELGLPKGQYCVVGKGPLAVRGICEAGDIEILVTDDLYAVFHARSGWEELADNDHRLLLSNPPHALTRQFGHGEYWPDPDMLIAAADIVDNVAFAPLEEIMMLKRALDRAQDHTELALIGEYLHEHPDDDLS